jgi:hypothetical protein
VVALLGWLRWLRPERRGNGLAEPLGPAAAPDVRRSMAVWSEAPGRLPCTRARVCGSRAHTRTRTRTRTRNYISYTHKNCGTEIGCGTCSVSVEGGEADVP